MPVSRPLGTLPVLTLLLGGLTWYGAPSAVAEAAGPRAAGDPTSVTLVLTAPDPDALSALAAQPITDRQDRLAELATLLPSPEQRAEVVAGLRAEGFTVTGQTSWSVTATGTEAQVDRRFGDTSTEDQPLPDLPARLDDLVTAAYPTTTDDPTFASRATSTLSGADVRNAGTAAGVSPSNGRNDAGQTVATLQLADFEPGDLSHYAASLGLPDPVASGQYRAIEVDGGPADAGDGGDVEVALDQEAILATAPTARQAAYFAPNTFAGFSDGLASVLDDVTGGAGATAPDPHITALSVSWGACESRWRAPSINAVQSILASLVAAGVTVFAASGDTGIYDCRSPNGSGRDNSQEDVDFPASSPAVVAVGGTRLRAATSAPNSGTNWTETGWSCADPVSCQSTSTGTGGTGGGVSGSAYRSSGSPAYFAGFTKPSYQSAYVTNGAYAAATRRLVPDIAAAGDPASGFVIYTSNAAGGTSHLAVVGGTSLSAPLSAALLVDTLGDSGVTTGVGDIHAALYRAYAETSGLAATDPRRVFRDVTSGSNGAAGNARVDPSVAAGPGYDTNTGLGGVLWPALAPYLSLPPRISSAGSTDPVATVPGPVVAPVPVGTVDNVGKLFLSRSGGPHHPHRVVVATWNSTATGPGVARTTVRLTRGGATAYAGKQSLGRTRVPARPGTYTLVVTTTDSAGHVATTVRHLTVRRPAHRPPQQH